MKIFSTIFTAIVCFTWTLYCIWWLPPIQLAKSHNSVRISHVTKDGTMWVEIDGCSYYLYLEDNGTPIKLEMK